MKRIRLIILAVFSVVAIYAQEVTRHDTIYIKQVDTIYIAQAVVIQNPQNKTDSDSIAAPKRNSFGDKLRTSPFHLGVEIQTKYMWRGIEYGTAPTLFPQISFDKWGLNIYAMGGYAVNGSHSEVD